MSMTVTQAKKSVSDLGDAAVRVLTNPQLSNAQKSQQLTGIESRMVTASAELQNAQYVAEKRAAMGGSQMADHADYASPNVSTRNFVHAEPSLALDPSQQQAMFKSLQDRMPFQTRAATSANVDPAKVPAQYLPAISAAREPTRILDVLPASPTTAGSAEYYRTTGTAAAAPVAEGAPKPESGLSLTRETAGVTKIATWVEFTEEALADFPAFAAILAGDLIAGIIDAENRELLSGTGVGASKFKGLLLTPGVQNYARKVGDTLLDALEIGGTMLRAGGRFTEASAIVMHPLDYSRARRTKTTQGAYIAGDPTAAGPAQLWGVPVIQTSQIAEGKALTGNFAEAAHVWVREGISYRTNPNGTGFRSNKVEALSEERLALGVLAPSALTIIDLTDPA